MPLTLRQRIFKRFFLRPCVRCVSSKNNNILTSAYENVDIPNVTLSQFVFENFHRFPEKIGIECSVTGKKYTYEEIRRKSLNLSKGLRKILKLKNGDVVAILLPNVPEFPIWVLGSLEANLTVTCINPTFTAGEIKNQLVDSNAKAIVTLSTLYPVLNAAMVEMKYKIPIVNVKFLQSEASLANAIDFNELANTPFDIDEEQPNSTDSTAFLLYSSGTTGLPKGVKLSHKNVVSNLCQIDHPYFKVSYDTTDGHQDVIPGILPWFHVAGLNPIMLLYMRYLCKLVPVPKFTPERYIEVLTKFKPNLMFVVPPLVSFMSSHPSVKREYLRQLRVIVCGAAPLSPLEEEKMSIKTEGRTEVIQGYGLTETSPLILATSFIKNKEMKCKGSIGEVLPNTMVKVVSSDNSTEDPLGPNKSGELYVKGPQVANGYYNRPEETKEAFVDGWFRTGDLVHYNENRMFYIQDRLKELIKVKGFQVAPAELEDLIRKYPGIADAAVIGISSDRYGEVPGAFVVLKENVKLDKEELKKFVSKNVAEYKTLKGGVVVVDSIPKNAAGKTLRRQLKLKYENTDVLR